MGRARIIVAATGLALLGIAVPIIATLAMSWHLAVRNEQQRLDQFAALAAKALERKLATRLSIPAATRADDVEAGEVAAPTTTPTARRVRQGNGHRLSLSGLDSSTR